MNVMSFPWSKPSSSGGGATLAALWNRNYSSMLTPNRFSRPRSGIKMQKSSRCRWRSAKRNSRCETEHRRWLLCDSVRRTAIWTKGGLYPASWHPKQTHRLFRLLLQKRSLSTGSQAPLSSDACSVRCLVLFNAGRNLRRHPGPNTAATKDSAFSHTLTSLLLSSICRTGAAMVFLICQHFLFLLLMSR